MRLIRGLRKGPTGAVGAGGSDSGEAGFGVAEGVEAEGYLSHGMLLCRQAREWLTGNECGFREIRGSAAHGAA